MKEFVIKLWLWKFIAGIIGVLVVIAIKYFKHGRVEMEFIRVGLIIFIIIYILFALCCHVVDRIMDNYSEKRRNER